MMSSSLRSLGLGVFCGVLSLSCLRAEQSKPAQQSAATQQPVMAEKAMDQIPVFSKKLTPAKALYQLKNEVVYILNTLKQANNDSRIASENFDNPKNLKRSIQRINFYLSVVNSDVAEKFIKHIAEQINSGKKVLESLSVHNVNADRIKGAIVGISSAGLCYHSLKKSPVFEKLTYSFLVGLVLGELTSGVSRELWANSCLSKLDTWYDEQIKITNELFKADIPIVEITSDSSLEIETLDNVDLISHKNSATPNETITEMIVGYQDLCDKFLATKICIGDVSF